MSDGDGSVARGERRALAALGAPFSTPRTCRVHPEANVAKHSVQYMMPDHCSGVINAALAQQKGGPAEYRRILIRLVWKRKRLLIGRPGQVDDIHRKALLDACLPVDPRYPMSLRDRVKVERCANGAYWKPKTFEIWSPTPLTPADVRERVKDWLSVVGPTIPVLRTSRWTEARRPVRQLGLLLGTHSLGKDAFLLWASTFQVVPRQPGVRALMDVAPGGAAAAGDAPGDVDEYRRELRANRQQCVDFMAKEDVVHRHHVFQQAVDAQQEWVYETLHLGSQAFDDKEEALCALAASRGQQYERRYRVELVASGTLERKFLTHIYSLVSEPERWHGVGPGGKTGKLRCEAFRTLQAEAGYAVLLTMGADAKGWPNKGYVAAIKGLRERRFHLFADAVCEAPQCQLDQWTLGVCAAYPGTRLEEQDACTDVALHGITVICDCVERAGAFEGQARPLGSE